MTVRVREFPELWIVHEHNYENKTNAVINWKLRLSLSSVHLSPLMTEVASVVMQWVKPVISVTDKLSHRRSRPLSYKVTLWNCEARMWFGVSSHPGTECVCMIAVTISNFWKTCEQGGNQKNHSGANKKPGREKKKQFLSSGNHPSLSSCILDFGASFHF